MHTFRIKIPNGNEKKSEAFGQLLKNLHEALSGSRMSFEILTERQHTAFCFSCEDADARLITGQVYSIFPDAEIDQIDDPLEDFADWAGAEVTLERPDLYPIKTYDEFEGDPLSGLLSVLSKIELKDTALIQYIVEPQADTGSLHFGRKWKRRFDSVGHTFRVKYWFKEGDIKGAFKEAFEKKSAGKLYRTSIRVLASSDSAAAAKGLVKSVAGAFQQFNTVDLNKCTVTEKSSDGFLSAAKKRGFGADYLLSEPELATLFHLPSEKEVPNLIYVLSKKAEPAASLPTDQDDEDVCFFGATNFHNANIPFGIRRADRRRHLYTVGKSGSGKSKLLELLIQNDLKNGKGVAVLDPHGDLVDNILRMVPPERMKDVVLFDPSDEEFPLAFNPLEEVPSALKMRVTLGFIEIFKKLFGSNWSERLEHVLRYTVLALLDSPETTVLSIQKMLTDKNYRQGIVKNIEDDAVKSFWVHEFAGWSQKFDSEAITPLLNKVGQFVATNTIRNIVGQPDNRLNFREIMDGEKILLMKISKGLLGEENAQLLGAFAVTKIYQAAMSRADVPEEQRKDFYFYVDEFQNFATDTFDEILSEARKYRLNITLAHQFLGQLSPSLMKTVFGNVGSMITFRVGADDAKTFAAELAPTFSKHDILNLGVREFYTKMTINGEATQPFSGRTLDLTFPEKNIAKEAVKHSRQTYCRPVQEVNKIIAEWEGKEPPAEDGGGGAKKKVVRVKQADESEKDFSEPII